MQRLDVGDLADLMLIAPGEEPHGSVVIGLPRVLVADGGGEEFEEAAAGAAATAEGRLPVSWRLGFLASSDMGVVRRRSRVSASSQAGLVISHQSDTATCPASCHCAPCGKLVAIGLDCPPREPAGWG
jgi:hypothetical protein